MTDTSKTTAPSADKSGFRGLAQRLIDAGLPIPTLMELAVAGDVRPLAIGSRETWTAWATARNYDTSQTKLLIRLIGVLVHSRPDRVTPIDDLSQRFDIDGNAVEPVYETDRHSAALLDYSEALRLATKAQ